MKFKIHLISRKKRFLALGLVLALLLPLVLKSLLAARIASADSFFGFEEGYGSSVNDNTGTITGTVTNANWQSEYICHHGKCLYFNGNSWISFGDESSYDFASSTDFSIQFWFKHATTSSAETIIHKYEGTGADGGYRIRMESDGDISFGVDDANGGFADDNITSTAANYDDSNWHFVSAVKDGTTGIYLYIDGYLVASDETIGSTGNLTNDDTFYIGDSNASNDGDEYMGYLDEVKIYTSTARSESEIKTDFTGGSAVFGSYSYPVQETTLYDGLVGYWPMDETADNTCSDGRDFCDYSGNNNNGDINLFSGGSITHAAGQIKNSSYHNSGWEVIQFNDKTQFENQQFTLTFWAKVNNYSASLEGGVAKGNIFGAVGEFSYTLDFNNGNGRGKVVFNGGTFSSTSLAISDSNWHMWTLTYDGTATKLYKDAGTPNTDSATTGTIDFAQSNNNFTVGGRDDGNWSTDDGNYDDIRLYNRALTPEEITELYTHNPFNKPTPIVHYNFDQGTGTGSQAVKDVSGNLYHGTMEASMTNSDWVTGKYGKAMEFDGSNDYVDVGNGPFAVKTVSFWAKPATTTEYLIDLNGSAYIWANSGTVTATGFTSPTVYVNGVQNGSLSANQWSHVSVVTSTGVNATDLDLARVEGSGYMEGAIDDVRIYTYTRTAQQVVEDMNAGHPAGGSPISSMVGYWNLDEQYGQNVYDNGYGGNNGTRGANTGSSTDDPSWKTESDCKVNGCLSFDGDDYVKVTDSSDFDFDTMSGFTISAWIKPNTLNAMGITSKYDSHGEYQYAFWINSNTLYFEIGSDDVWSAQVSTTEITAGEWTHITGTYDKSNLILYINGKQVDSQAETRTVGSLNNPICIGSVRYDCVTTNGLNKTDNRFNGIIDEVKIYTSALTQEQVLIDMNGGAVTSFGVLGDSEAADIEGGAGNTPVAYWDFNAGSGTSLPDISGNNNTGTLGGDGAGTDLPTWRDVLQPPSFANGLSGKTLEFDGDNDFIDAGSDTTIDDIFNGGGNLTFWINPASAGEGSTGYIFTKNPGNAGWFLQNQGCDANNVDLYMRIDSSGTDGQYRVDCGLAINQWSHVSINYDDDTLSTDPEIYINGSLQSFALNTDASVYDSDAANSLIIGSFNTSGLGAFHGQLDGIKMYGEERSSAQIAYDYNRGSPVAWWKMDDNINTEGQTIADADNNSHSGTLFGNNSTGDNGTGMDCTVSGKYNLGCQFDGVDDYVSISNESTFDFDTNSLFSIGAWIKTSSTNITNMIFGKAGNGGDITPGYYLNLRNNGNGTRVNFDLINSNGSAGRRVQSIDSVNDNQWHYITVTYDGSNSASGINIYIDGVLSKETILDTNPGSILNNLTPAIGMRSVGASNPGPYTGLIDDVRIYNYPLSQSQIEKVMNESAVRFGPSEGSP